MAPRVIKRVNKPVQLGLEPAPATSVKTPAPAESKSKIESPAPVQQVLEPRPTKKSEIPPVTVPDSPLHDPNKLAFWVSEIEHVTITVTQIHSLEWSGEAGSNLRGLYFRLLEEYRLLAYLISKANPAIIINTLSALRKEVTETEAQLDLLLVAYAAQGKPEAVGAMIEKLGLRQARLYDQLDMLTPLTEEGKK